MWSLELVATATDSPRYSPGGGLRKFGTAVNGISGTPVIVALSCACAAPAHSTTASAQVDVKSRFIDSLPGVWQMVGFPRGRAPLPVRTLPQDGRAFNRRGSPEGPHEAAQRP